MAVALLLTGPLLHADDKKPSDSDGYKQVPIRTGDKTTYLRVKTEHDPYANLSPSSRSFFSKESPLANKQFDSGNAPVSRSSGDSFQQQTFLTKSYSVDAGSNSDITTPNVNTKVTTASATAYGQNASGFDRSFTTSSSDAARNKKALFASNTSDFQGRTATLGSQQIDVPGASPLAGKPYQGPEADKVHQELGQVNSGLSRMSGLPNRALTIDEVRNLINHETKPDTNARPEPASKPLNDPDYKPVPLRILPPADDDKGDLVPSPGMAAAAFHPPENSEPLPK
jgi:hypothetical protein